MDKFNCGPLGPVRKFQDLSATLVWRKDECLLLWNIWKVLQIWRTRMRWICSTRPGCKLSPDLSILSTLSCHIQNITFRIINYNVCYARPLKWLSKPWGETLLTNNQGLSFYNIFQVWIRHFELKGKNFQNWKIKNLKSNCVLNV